MLSDDAKGKLLSPSMTPDIFFQKIVQPFLEGRLAKDSYLEAEAFFLANNPNRTDIENLRRRLDSRTIAEFATSLMAHTKKERFLMELFVEQMAKRRKKVTFKDNGVDNLGAFIGSADSGIPKADFLVTVEGWKERPYEVKNSPSRYKTTFKKVNLEEYRDASAFILLFYGTGRLEDDPSKIDRENTRFCVIETAGLEKLLALPIRRYWEIGDKNGVQVTKERFSEFWTEHRLL